MHADGQSFHDVIVIGSGPAGMACALTAARGGASVLLADQRPGPGGAIFRIAIPGVPPLSLARAQKRLRDRLFAGLENTPAIQRLPEHLYLGLDADGLVMLEDRKAGQVKTFRCRILCLATGAVERVLPRPGWTLPGVVTAGGLQVMMKETGKAPAGRTVLAGSGPLLLAVAAQLVRLGTPPLAVIEAGDPLRQLRAGLGLLRWPGLCLEAGGYVASLLTARVPWHRGARLTGIETAADGLAAQWQDRRGRAHRLAADRIALHDGLAENSFGLAPSGSSQNAPGHPLVLQAGDCRQALGAPAAARGGETAGQICLNVLAGRTEPAERLQSRLTAATRRDAAAQDLIASAFAAQDGQEHFNRLPDDTMLCRCEGGTIGDLRKLFIAAPGLSGRELKLNGRFAMGACQGRFCAANTAAAVAELTGSSLPVSTITGHRWPVRPVPISSLIRPEAAEADHAEEAPQ